MNIHIMVNTEPAAVAEISSLEALRVVSDSQRHRILSLLIREPLTPSKIAKKLKIARTRVYYHLDLLKEHEFIRVVDERAVAAMTERTYRACAHRFHVDRRMLAATASESAVNAAQAQMLERAADDLRARPEDVSDSDPLADPNVLVSRSFLRLTPQQAQKLRASLVELVEQYAVAAGEASGNSYEMVLALFENQGEQL